MATVYERFNHLGLASSNSILTKVGCIIAEKWHQKHGEMSGDYKPLGHVFQKEGDKEYFVNYYEDSFTPEIDRIIMEFANGIYNG